MTKQLLFGPIVPWRSTKIKDIRGQEKDEKDKKMVSHVPQCVDLFEDSIDYSRELMVSF